MVGLYFLVMLHTEAASQLTLGYGFPVTVTAYLLIDV